MKTAPPSQFLERTAVGVYRLALGTLVAAATAFLVAACTKSSTPVTASCTVTVGAISTTTMLASGGGTGTIAVTADSGCAWTAMSGAAFITITSGSSGTGNGSVAFTVAANSTSADRTGTVTITGTTVTFTQHGLCTFTVSSTNLKVNSGGDTGTIVVTAPAATCSWTATSSSSFLTITSGPSGTGSGTVTFSASANGAGARSGTMIIAGQTITVTQDPGIFAAFNLLQPSQTTAAVTVCWFKGAPDTCTLSSTSYTQGTAPIVTYTWSAQYTYGTVKVFNASGPSSTLSFSDSCGGVGSTSDGAMQPLSVTLTVVDSLGNTATATAGSGNQPALFVQLFTCP